MEEARRVKELDGLKNRLYTNITHEFRTPLTVILGMVEQLAAGKMQAPRQEQWKQGLALIQRNGQNLLRLINQLLDLSKLEAGQLNVNMVRGDIVAYLQYLTESFYSMAEDKSVRLTFYSEEEELWMDYDEDKIQHIVYNLLSNAIKFTPPKGKVIFHVLKTLDIKQNGQSFLQMKIKDTGMGIPSEKLPHIFDRFYQVDDSATRRGEGTGIGLALVKELIELLKGDVLVESKLDKGTTFLIHLPISQEAALQEKSFLQKGTTSNLLKANTIAADDTAPTEKDAPLLLIVEDNPDVVIYMRSLLERDYNIQVAENGQIGIDKAVEIVPDIIISDVMMPEKNGYEVCEAIKADQRTSHIPIILLTARAEQQDRIEGLKIGADAYLTKPFNKEELMIRLEKLIEIRQKLQNRFAKYEKEQSDAKSNTLEDTESKFLQGLTEAIKKHLDNPDFGVPQLAQTVLMSQMQVYRKLKALTGKTPSQFIRSIRLQKGMELLKTSDLTISEIAYEVGFADPNYFSKTFQQEFRRSPRSIRNHL